MPETRQENSLGNGPIEEPRTPEPTPDPLNEDHDLPTVKTAHQQLKCFSSTENNNKNKRQSRHDCLMDLGLMLPVLEEAEADLPPRTPPTTQRSRATSNLPPLRYSPSEGYTRFCHQTLPSMRLFSAGGDPRSVIPSSSSSRRSTCSHFLPLPQRSLPHPHDDPASIPASLCFPNIGEEEEQEEAEWEKGCYAMRLHPKRRRRERGA